LPVRPHGRRPNYEKAEEEETVKTGPYGKGGEGPGAP